MNMVWHNYVTLDRKVVAKTVQLIDVFISDLSVSCQFDMRTVALRGANVLTPVPTTRERIHFISFVRIVRNMA